MSEVIVYSIGPAARRHPAVSGGDEQARPWLAVAGPTQRTTGEMAARIAFLESKLAALEAGNLASR